MYNLNHSDTITLYESCQLSQTGILHVSVSYSHHCRNVMSPDRAGRGRVPPSCFLYPAYQLVWSCTGLPPPR